MKQCQATEDAGALQCALYDGHERGSSGGDGHSWASKVETWEGALERVTALCDEIATQRHRKYGPENVKATGEIGLWVRIMDKMARISRAMTTGEYEFPDEKFEDAMMDVVNYGRFWLMYRADQWELPALCLDERPPDASLESESDMAEQDTCPTCRGASVHSLGSVMGETCRDSWHVGNL